MFKVKNRNTRKRCGICSKLTIKTPERRQWRSSGVFIVNLEHSTPFSSVSIVDFEQVNICWVISYILSKYLMKFDEVEKNTHVNLTSSFKWRNVIQTQSKSVSFFYFEKFANFRKISISEGYFIQLNSNFSMWSALRLVLYIVVWKTC